ncbi:hypothetical protein K4F52_004795 [Lecanicillium sp. MT-2017a]|nr:hypothetical protein K4F52_004795 [Lecanicillium sp. MT-2017a]
MLSADWPFFSTFPTSSTLNTFDYPPPPRYAPNTNIHDFYCGPSMDAEIQAKFNRYGQVAATFTAVKSQPADTTGTPAWHLMEPASTGIVVVDGSQQGYADQARNVKYITSTGVVIANGSGRPYEMWNRAAD